jgi:aspartate racemase
MIGLVGGLGVGAAIHYYRELAGRYDDRRQPLALVMAHASITRATDYAANADRHGLADYLCGFMTRLRDGGATFGVVPAVTPHLCIDELRAMSPIPVVGLPEAVADAIRSRGLSRVALFGTRFVVTSDLYGRLSDVEVVRPREDEIAEIHAGYRELAHTGVASTAWRERFVTLADTVKKRDGVEAILLAGTDFAVMFDRTNTPFPHVDCAGAHIDAIARVYEASAR